MESTSNYEKLCAQWAQTIRCADLGRLVKLLPELRLEDQALTITHFGRTFRLDCQSGTITAADGGDASIYERLNIYTLLGYCQEGAHLTGQWVPFRDVRGAGPFAPAFDKSVLQPMAATFSGKVNALRDAALAMGGMPLPHSDAGFLLHAFDCIPMQFLFWDGDDEFPAQANILFDSGVTGFIHVESTVSLASVGIARLAETAGLPLAGSTF